MKTSCCNSSESITIGNSIICLNSVCCNYLGAAHHHRNFFAWKNPIAISLFAIQMMFSMDDFSMANKENNFTLIHEKSINQPKLNLNNLRHELVVQNILCANEVFAQMKLESAILSSSLLRNTNNIMGMRYPLCRPTTAIGIFIPSKNLIIYGNQRSLKRYSKISNYSVYKCWQDAVADYKLWQDNNFKLKERYLEYLGEVYAEDSNYISKIKMITTNEAH